MPERTAASTEDADLTSLFSLGAALVRGRWRIARWTILGGFVAALFATLRPLTYSAVASFVPQANETSASQLVNLAGQFGISLAPGGSRRSPDFYRTLLTSYALHDVIVRDTFRVAELNGREVSFVDLFDIDADVPAERLEMGRERLARILDTSVDNSTGIVSLSVSSRWPSVSLAITNALVEGVHAFNQRVRQDEAGAERAFIEMRLKDVHAELRAAEDSLQLFLLANRRFEGSPELVFEHDRLQRDVQSRQQVLNSLTQSYEEARIRELRNTPVISMVETPKLPVLHDPRRRILFGLLGMMLGGSIGIALALASTTVTHHRATGGSDVEELIGAMEELKGDLRSPTRWVRGLLRG
jgi:uncharacterized protein involved in exopolysaccharide biosynthesis